MIDPKIKTFLILVKEGSFTAAAKELCITQPAVSNQMRLIEEEYNTSLFLRSGRRLKLTAEGEILYKYAQRALTIEKTAHHALEDARHNIQRLNIGMTATAEENLLPQVIAEYCNIHQNTKVRIETGTLESLRTSLQSYQIDLAIVGGHIADDEFTTVKIDTDYLNLIVSPENPLAQQSRVTLEDLKQERLILRPTMTATRQQFETFLIQHGETIENYMVVIEINNVPIIKELVHDNQGVTIMSHNACLVDVLTGKLVAVPLEGSARMLRELNIVYRNNYRHPEVASEIRRIYLQLKEESFPNTKEATRL
ncbi:MAG TPA: LysR family transcriptional regulator [Sphaerochaeta sp.]|nr:LysR family transcriptional regulator [Sphaerochaeta sp.]